MADFDVDIANELLRLQQQNGRRAMASDAAFELIRASAGAAYSERYGLVTQKIVEEVARHFPDVQASTEEELRRLTPALADFTALLSTECVKWAWLGGSPTPQIQMLDPDRLRMPAVARTSRPSADVNMTTPNMLSNRNYDSFPAVLSQETELRFKCSPEYVPT